MRREIMVIRSAASYSFEEFGRSLQGLCCHRVEWPLHRNEWLDAEPNGAGLMVFLIQSVRRAVAQVSLADRHSEVKPRKALFCILFGAVFAWSGMSAATDFDVAFPDHPNVVHVTRPPYNAKGDGVTDDTAALQQAINENTGHGRILYFPPGTYLVSDTLTWPKRFNGHENWGKTTLQGASAAKCVIRLRDGTFTDPKNSRAIMWCGGFGSADWFHNYVQGLTFNVGKNNPGAIGLQFYANNYGAVRHCEIVSEDLQGAIGLDLGHRDMNGPLLVRKLTVKGFQRGVVTARAVNSQTFEHLTLSGQTEFGFDNHGQAISIRGLISKNSVPAVRSYGTMCLIEANLTGREGADKTPAVINYNGGRLHLRDITTTGYARAIGDVASPDFVRVYRIRGEDKPGSLGPDVKEYFSHPPTSPFPSAAGSLRLPIEETPEFLPDDPKSWAVVDAFGADPNGEKDSTEAIQKALDSGAETVFLPGHYNVTQTLTVGGKVKRVLGCGRWVDYTAKAKPDFRVIDGEAEVVTFEHFSKINGGIENASDRTLVLRSVGSRVSSTGRGKLFLEDVASDEMVVRNQTVFARQLNIENRGTHLLNEGCDLWILGYKTERGGTLIETRGGGRTELLGGFSYTTNSGTLAPMFVTEDSSVFTFFGEVCFTGDPFQTLIRETRGMDTKEVMQGEGGTWPYVGWTKSR
jgi:hypothetical protein